MTRKRLASSLLHLAVSASWALAATWSSSARADSCDFAPPLPPTPLPPDFDWRTLATAWCDELLECNALGSTADRDGCVGVYLQALASPQVGLIPAVDTLSGPEVSYSVSCQDSEEFKRGEITCNPCDGGDGGGGEGSEDPCSGSTDPCCGDPDPCCGSDDPCCGSLDPCCGSNDPCCGNPDPCCADPELCRDTDGDVCVCGIDPDCECESTGDICYCGDPGCSCDTDGDTDPCSYLGCC
ncbi:MAG: hypothetical protein K1X88_13390 [Nannocystaceae bacterium]|nr:hypothetical protein [Nannocystaceae bacterium]